LYPKTHTWTILKPLGFGSDSRSTQKTLSTSQGKSIREYNLEKAKLGPKKTGDVMTAEGMKMPRGTCLALGAG
jgi:hypothetical protein